MNTATKIYKVHAIIMVETANGWVATIRAPPTSEDLLGPIIGRTGAYPDWKAAFRQARVLIDVKRPPRRRFVAKLP